MARPTRLTSAKLKSYVDDSADEFDPPVSDEEDESFDEDDDPDKIEVPGGGTTLEDARNIAPTTVKAEPSSSSSSIGTSYPTFNPTTNLISNPTPNSSTNKGTSQHGLNSTSFSSSSSSSNTNNIHRADEFNMGPNPLFTSNPIFDPSMFQNLLNPMANSNMGNPLHQLLKLFPSNYSSNTMNNPVNQMTTMAQLSQLYGMLAYQQAAQKNLFSDPGVQKPIFSDQVLVPPKIEKPEEETQDDEDLVVAETYADYIPAKLKFGKSHPDAVVETASLASVQPPEVTYKLHLPDKCIDKGWLSALQLEAVVYACQKHESFLQSGERAGYLIGDGAGVGKGRTIAGIIFENYLCGRKKALWVSVSADLKEDSERDLRDIGANTIKVTAINKLKYGRINRSDVKDGVLYSTYSGLIGQSRSGARFNSRYKQIVEWLGKDFDGLIVFDECHRAKNLCPVGNSKPTQTGLTVQLIQNDLKKARVVYASATGASEPKNMAYMTRLGIWGKGTPFREFSDFINAVEKRGIGAMEIVAMDMKLRGMYIARQLSFKGVGFTIEEVPLKEPFQKMYNESVDLWVEALQKFIEAAELMKADNTIRKCMWAQFWASHQRFFKYLCIAAKVDKAIAIAREAVKDGKCVVIGLQSTGEARTAEQKEREGELEDFVSTAKGVFQSLVEKHFPAPDRNKVRRLLGISMLDGLFEEAEPQPGPSSSSTTRKPTRKAAQNAAKRGRWNESDESANEANDSDFSDSNASSSGDSPSTDSKASGSDFESVSSEMDSDGGAPTTKKGKKKLELKRKAKAKAKANQGPRDVPSKEAVDRACQMRQDLLSKIEKLGDTLPNNTLDQLIDELGGTSDVAEMTGRKMRLVQNESGKIEYQSRSESDVSLDQINIREKQRFMDDDKRIAIISEAASSGISLQSDRRVKNKRRRVHITLELPWSADRAIQQFGRTHRSNQVNAPEYVFLISDLAGENRFASIVAKRLESLGALTHGDRRATESRDLSRFHIDNHYGKVALESVMKYIMSGSTSTLPALPPTNYEGDFRTDVAGGLVGVGLIVNNEDNPGVAMPEKDYHNMSKFLNRILGMHVNLQNALFKFFTDTLAAIIGNAKKQGRFDMGILNLGDSNDGKVNLVETKKFKRKHATGSGLIELHTVTVERGINWEEAEKKFGLLIGENEGFYLGHDEKVGKRLAVLVIGDDLVGPMKKDKKSENDRYYSVYRPSTGLQLRKETLRDIKSKFYKVTPEKAKKHWELQYERSDTRCIHAFWADKCKNIAAGFSCEVGKRMRKYYVLSGSVLLCWDDVERVLGRSSPSAKIQIVRAQFEDGMKLVGLLIPDSSSESLADSLIRSEEKMRLETEALEKEEEGEMDTEDDIE